MPIPSKHKGETKKHYAGRVISTEMHHGKPKAQAVAIGLKKAGMSRKK